MQVALPESGLPARLILNPEHRLTDEDYYAFCAANPDLRLERTAQGEIIIVPPAGGEGSYRSGEAYASLRQWARRDGRGKAFDCSVAFLLPDGSSLSPEAAWVSHERLMALTKAQRRSFLPLCPEFVIEVMSPSDRLPAAQKKMETWIANGVQLAWLIDGDARTVYVYGFGRDVEKKSNVAEIAGDGPVHGLVLELGEIWTGL